MPSIFPLLSLTCCVLLLHCVMVAAQPNANIKGVRQQKRQRLRGMKEENKLFNALTVQYPLHFFDFDSKPWRTAAKYDATSATAPEMASKPWLEQSLAQDQEDVWLYENWFYGMRGGVIMESGALDGVLFSTSYLFENFAGWTAIHVEADPENFKSLQTNRDRAVNVHGALCSEPKLLHYSSAGVIPVRGFVEFMSQSFLKKWHGKIYNNITKIDSLPTVQCLPVRKLLGELHVTEIDLWILDTEGSEESVLKGVDWAAVRFNAVAMECDAHDSDKNDRKMRILEQQGNMQCALVERNCMCKHKNFSPSESPHSKTALMRFDGNKRSVGYKNTNKDTTRKRRRRARR